MVSGAPSPLTEPPQLRGFPLAAVVLCISVVAALAAMIDMPVLTEFVRRRWDYLGRDDAIGAAIGVGLFAIAGAVCGTFVVRRWWGLPLGMACGALFAVYLQAVVISSPSFARVAAAGAMVLVTALATRAGSR